MISAWRCPLTGFAVASLRPSAVVVARWLPSTCTMPAMDDIAALPALSRAVAAAATHATIDLAAVERFADGLTKEAIASVVPPAPSAAEESAPPAERVALVMAQMAVNFCYFPEAGAQRWWVLSSETGEPVGRDDEANAMTAALREAWSKAQQSSAGGFASGEYLASMSDDVAAEVFKAAPGAGVLPMLAQRALALRELGAALQSAGGVAKLFATANGDAATLCEVLTTHCPTFDDRRENPVAGAAPLRFLKRAQLCASALAACSFEGFALEGVEKLTVFSDYRLPQLFQLHGMMVLSPALAAKVRGGEELLKHSIEEVEIRAATIAIADAVLARANSRDGELGLSAAKFDYWCWRTAVAAEDEGLLAAFPFHRTRTTDY